MADCSITNFLHYQDRIGFDPDKFFKATFFQSSRLLVGINCLEPGQTQSPHTHTHQDKFYFVIEGLGEFIVGEDTQEKEAGSVIWAAAGVHHGVTNTGDQRLVLLVGIAPAPRS